MKSNLIAHRSRNLHPNPRHSYERLIEILYGSLCLLGSLIPHISNPSARYKLSISDSSLFREMRFEIVVGEFRGKSADEYSSGPRGIARRRDVSHGHEFTAGDGQKEWDLDNTRGEEEHTCRSRKRI